MAELRDESWEFQNNTSNRMLFKSADFDSMYTDPETLEEYPAWKNDFEARFPDDTWEDTTQLKTFMDWIVSTDRTQATGDALPESVTYGGITYTSDTADYRLAKFSAEVGDYVELDSFVFYYIYTELFLMVDSRAKNLFIGFHGSTCPIEGIRRKLVAEPYDMDTAMGTNNEGTLAFSYSLEDTDQVNGADVFNGQRSVFWNNLRDSKRAEIVRMYQGLRSSGALSYTAVESRFEESQKKWPEALWMEDAQVKYIEPLVDPQDGKEATDFYLPMHQGTKEQQRKWWLMNRFRYMDSKWNAGDALSQVIQLRGYAKADISVTPYIDLYPTVKYGSYLVQKRGTAGVASLLECPMDNVDDTEIYIYSAPSIASVGDLSGLKVGVADFSQATNIQEIKLGDADPTYTNNNMKSLSFGNNVLLKKVDARNCKGLGTAEQKSVDVSNCAVLEEVYFEGTSIQGLTLPNGGVLRVLHLPAPANITVLNQKHITDFSVESYENVTTLRLENSSLDARAILGRVPTNTRVRLVGVAWEADDAEEIDELYDLLDTMRGLDENGNNTDAAQVSGTIHVPALRGSEVAEFQSRYPYIRINADAVASTLLYKSYDGTETLKTVTCHNGVPQSAAPSIPSRSSTDQYTYTAVGWNTSEDAQTALYPTAGPTSDMQADTTLYAAYSRTVRTYTITWKNSDGTILETDNNVEYGADPQYNGSTPQNPASGGGSFTGWTPSISTVTGNQTYTASYIPTYTVVWYNDDRSTELYRTTVQQGSDAAYAGTNPPVSTQGDDYTFTGWDKVTTNVQSNLQVYAQFRAPSDAPTATNADGAYGVEWDYSNSATTLTRKGLAAAFADPTPATSVSGNGSSPFDTIAPWKDMKRYNVVGSTLIPDTDNSFSATDNDTVVYIPEFYYTAYKDTVNSKWLWAISPTAKDGYKKHPGSGKYIGRYHTSGSSSAVYTKSGVNPLANTSQTDFRSYSTAKGTGWRMLDLATWSALQMLYLVEFANFDSQTVLGKGWNTGSVGSMGGTDSAVYHTVKTTGAHNQYRWVEDPFSNVRDWIDGFMGSTSATYAAANSSYAGGSSDLTSLGLKLPSSGYIKGFGYSENASWAFIPDTSGGSESTYVPDYVNSSSSARPAFVGGGFSDYALYGLFCFAANGDASSTVAYLGSRLLYDPD